MNAGYGIRYRPDSPLGRRFPNTAYPTTGALRSRAAAEQLRDACPNADQMEIIEVNDQ